MQVSDIMTQRVLTVSPGATVAQAIALMQYQKVRSLIVEPDAPQGSYGILTERDVVYQVMAKGYPPEQVRVSEIMRQPCIVIAADLTVEAAAQRFAETGLQRAPVVEASDCGQRRLVGVLSVTDIVMKFNLGQDWQDPLSHPLQAALRQARVVCTPAAQITQECEIAWEVVEQLSADVISNTVASTGDESSF
ncbi:CBS domain-containing protein [Almyronema epifaneia]|uniref:CBS domain-containing protein n=1 Tax=Almyronema epifaneia S1 TaxID=2991925 RepID=A0ABW6I8Z5_9CYAN